MDIKINEDVCRNAIGRYGKMIMMEQLKMMINPEILQDRVDFKINRLRERLQTKAKDKPFFKE